MNYKKEDITHDNRFDRHAVLTMSSDCGGNDSPYKASSSAWKSWLMKSQYYCGSESELEHLGSRQGSPPMDVLEIGEKDASKDAVHNKLDRRKITVVGILLFANTLNYMDRYTVAGKISRGRVSIRKYFLLAVKAHVCTLSHSHTYLLFIGSCKYTRSHLVSLEMLNIHVQCGLLREHFIVVKLLIYYTVFLMCSTLHAGHGVFIAHWICF